MTKKVCVVTGSRAEYGLLYWLMNEINRASDLELMLVVTGMHLSPEFGMTYRDIEQDGFRIDRRVEMLLSADTPSAISKSTGLALIGMADAYQELAPNIVVVLGDRFEMLAAAAAALFARIPVAHLHGGESSEGAFDEAIRHSITKMSYLHFTATEEYRHRVIQLGEDPKRVFCVGALGLDNIEKLNLLNRDMFQQSIGCKLAGKNVLVTFHPATLETTKPARQFEEILMALDELEDTHIIFSKSNSDTDGRVINKMIDDYVATRPYQTCCFDSMGARLYLSALQWVDAVVGNSSSGLIEAPAFRIGTINIGRRQQGRVKPPSVIDCEPEKKSILSAIELVYSRDFQKILKSLEHPYGEAGAAKKVRQTLQAYDLSGGIMKSFHDIKFSV